MTTTKQTHHAASKQLRDALTEDRLLDAMEDDAEFIAAMCDATDWSQVEESKQ